MFRFLLFLSLSCFNIFSMQNSINQQEVIAFVSIGIITTITEDSKNEEETSIKCYLLPHSLDNDSDKEVSDYLQQYSIDVSAGNSELLPLNFSIEWWPKKTLKINIEKNKTVSLYLPEECYKVRVSKCNQYFILYCFVIPQESNVTDLIIVPVKSLYISYPNFAIEAQTFEVL